MPRSYPQSWLDSQKEAWRRHVSLYQVLLTGAGDTQDYYFADYDAAVTATLPPLSVNPLAIAGLQLWLAADRISGLADGAGVALWADQSGLDNHATQATAANQPTYKANIVNGRPVVRFNGTSQYLDGNALSGFATVNDPMTVFIVAKMVVAGAQYDFFDLNSALPGSGDSPCLRVFRDSSNNLIARRNGPQSSVVDSSTVFHVIEAQANNAAVALFRDGTQTGSSVAGAMAVVPAVYRVGRGTGAAVSEFLNGDIAEVLVYNRILSASEYQSINAYLGAKYGVTMDASSVAQKSFQPFGHKRGKATSRTNLQVDEMTLAVPNAEVPYLGTPVRLSFLAVKGYLDGATLNLFKWDAFNPLQTAVWHSGWLVQEVTASRTSVSFRLRSQLAVLNREAPRTIYQTVCNNATFDQWCGLNLTTYKDSVAALVGSTWDSVQFTAPTAAKFVGQNPAPNQAGYYDGGKVTCTSGLNKGVWRGIYQTSLSAGVVTATLIARLPFQVNIGDTFDVLPGDDKTIGTCVAKFNNLTGWRGFSNIPKPETVL